MPTTPDLINRIDPSNQTCIGPLSEEERYQFTVLLNLTSLNYAPRPPNRDVKITFVFFFCLILLAGLIANILVIVWITKGKLKKSSIDVHIVSLSIADLLSVLTSIPLNTALLWLDGNWADVGPESQVTYLCKGGIYLQNVSLCISSLTLVIVAIDRVSQLDWPEEETTPNVSHIDQTWVKGEHPYNQLVQWYIAICHPFLHYKYSSYKQKITVVTTVVIWLVGSLIGIRDLVHVRLSKSIEEIDNLTDDAIDKFFVQEIIFVADYDFYDKHSLMIPATHPECKEFVYYRLCLEVDHFRNNAPLFFVLVYVVPVVVMIFCYGSIIHRLWVRKPVGDVTHISEVDKKVNKASTRQTIVMMVVLITAFGILWLPYWCKKIYETHRALCHYKLAVFDSVDQSFIILTYLSIISTPIIYMLLDRNFRKVIKQKFVALGVSLVDPLINCLDSDHKPSANTGELHQVQNNHYDKSSSSGHQAQGNRTSVASNIYADIQTTNV